jgi:hypothetical protein
MPLVLFLTRKKFSFFFIGFTKENPYVFPPSSLSMYIKETWAIFVKKFVFCSQNKNINKQLKIQNTFKNTKIVFIFISHQKTFLNQKKKKTPKTH